jgi:hypothetical protein
MIDLQDGGNPKSSGVYAFQEMLTVIRRILTLASQRRPSFQKRNGERDMPVRVLLSMRVIHPAFATRPPFRRGLSAGGFPNSNARARDTSGEATRALNPTALVQQFGFAHSLDLVKFRDPP